jgi:hypothetical protein
MLNESIVRASHAKGISCHSFAQEIVNYFEIAL